MWPYTSDKVLVFVVLGDLHFPTQIGEFYLSNPLQPLAPRKINLITRPLLPLAIGVVSTAFYRDSQQAVRRGDGKNLLLLCRIADCKINTPTLSHTHNRDRVFRCWLTILRAFAINFKSLQCKIGAIRKGYKLAAYSRSDSSYQWHISGIAFRFGVCVYCNAS